ncbi:MAG: efflux RND transporter periplasmic adaptor subunit [Burkholderiaceae bacterium]
MNTQSKSSTPASTPAASAASAPSATSATSAAPPASEPRAEHRSWLRIGAPFAVAAVVLAVTLLSRLDGASALAAEAGTQNLATLSVVHAKPGPDEQELVLPASVRAAIDTPIYARTNGYLKRWLVDIGTPVKAGQLMAEIETPEVDDSLRQTQAALAHAQADRDLAQVTADRWAELAKTNAVAHQDVDQKLADLHAKQAVLEGARADLARLQQLESFKRVLAPFDGVVTARHTDVGALINSGSAGSVTELFHLTQTRQLRISADIPQAYAALAQVGQPASIEIADQPGAALSGQISRRAEAIDPVARTLHVELDVDNPGGRLLAGSYAQIHFRLADAHPALSLPVATLLFRADGPQVAVVDRAGKVALTKVVLGRNDGKSVQVLQGLSQSQAVAMDPPDSLVDGEQVRVATAAKGA